MSVESAKKEIQDLLEFEIKKQLGLPWVPKTYAGTPKPVNGAFPKNNTKFLQRNISVNIKGGTEDNYEIDISVSFGAASNYGYIVEKGRKPGIPYQKTIRRRKKDGSLGEPFTIQSYTGYPPLKNIESWVKTKPALNGITEVKTRTFLAARSIARDGIGATNFVEKGFVAATEVFEDKLGELAREIFQSYLDKLRRLD